MKSMDYYISEVYAGMGMSSDDTLLDRRQISEWMSTGRATVVRNVMTNDKFHIDESLYQVIPCLKMELVDRSLVSCCNETFAIGCTILRSVLPLPKLLFVKGQYGEGSSLIVYKPDVMDFQVNYATRNAGLYGGSGRYNKKAIYTWVEFDSNGSPYLYLSSKDKNLAKRGEVLYVKGIFANPEDLKNYVGCDGVCAYTDNSEYPIADWMWEPIRQVIIQKIATMYGKVTDKTNNAADDTMFVQGKNR